MRKNLDYYARWAEFTDFIRRLSKFGIKLSNKEVRYLWFRCNNLSIRAIIKLEERNFSRQAVSYIICRALKKIKDKIDK
jgi:hypothetical protein